MPAGFYAPSSEIEPVVGIQICVFSPDEIERRSVVEVTNSGTYEGNEPKIGGLFDPRMGVLDNGKECRSCGQTNHKCPGHFGHFRLARPVYYIQFLPFIQNVLSCVCIRCSKLLVDKSFRKHFLKRKGEARWRDVLTASKEIKRCGQETEDGCGARQPTRYVREGIARIVAEWDSIDSVSTAEDASKSGKQSQPLEVEFVLRLFRRILDEDVDFMGLSRYWCRPDWMICTVLPIPPPQVRPSVIQDNNQRSEDDLTHKLAEIIKTNNTYLQPRIQANAAKSVIDEWTNVLQYHIATLVDNQIPGVAPSAQRNGRPLKSIQQRLGSKEGRIRYNIQGKRVEFSARSVITPDPNISIAELGVPEKIAMNLTRPERVTEFNRQKLYKFVQNGPNVFPGAKTIRRGLDGRIVSLRHVNTKDVVLHYGDIVNRHLMDGDIVLFNRQPTLHRMSMMAHKVKVLKYKTFRLNVSVTAPYNADFDGDEMNMHCPQSYEAATELEEIAAVPHQILRPRDGLPVIGVVQDTLVGSYRLTRQHVKFNRREFMNLMMWNRRFDGTVPEGKADDGRWTGHQVLSQLMPAINMDMMNSSKKKVVIRDGEVLEGQFDKSTFSKASKGIIHMTYNDYGSKQTVDLLDAMQNTIEQFLIYNGFSVGISDLIADSATKDEMNVKIQEKKSDVETILLSIHQDLFDNNTGKTNQAEFEDKIFGILNKATELSGEIGYNSLANENRMTAMVRAGSKGGPINIAQMIACVGQQNIEGKRIPYGFEDRTLPHFKKYDDGAEARGFIQNSFINGLTPTEFFFHAMSGREGLIDTAVKSVTGDTKIVVIENGVSKCVAIGDWVDGHLAGKEKETEFFEAENNLEILQLTSDTYIPTVTPEGKVSWGKVAAVTRHDPGQELYEVKTLGGRSVIVPESKSLLVWDSTSRTFEKMDTPSVRPGHCMPVTMKLSEPPVIYESIPLSNYLPKSSYIYGTDFQAAEVTADTGYIQRQLVKAMEDLVVQHDGTVRDANMNIAQFHYGEDGINSTKIESQTLEFSKLSRDDIARDFGLEGVDLVPILADGLDRGDDKAALKAFAEQVRADQKMVVEGVFRSGNQGQMFSAVNLDRLLLNLKIKFGLNDQVKTNLTPLRVLAGIEAVLDKTQRFHKMWAALLRYTMSPLKMIVKERFTESAFDTLCELLVTKNWQAWVQPGEQVGIIAAQSIGEPSTQMTLNTFHLAGVASKSNVTRGVPRLKELLKVTQNPKAVSLTIPLKKEYQNSKAKAREVSQELELTLLRDMTIKTAIYFDPKDNDSVLKEDRELLAFYKMFEQDSQEDTQSVWSKYILRLEFNRQNMFDKNITMDDILFVLRRRFEDEVQMVYSDFNSQKLVMRIRLSEESLATSGDPASLDALASYKKFQNKLLNAVIIRGLPGIKAATFRKGSERLTYNEEEGKYKTSEEYILDTDGSNFLEVMNHPAVDATRVTSTHVHDVYPLLGIEATRHTLYTEITTLFEDGQINYRHLGLLVDVMTRAGRLMSVDRYGINKLDIGPLAKASFEETERILLKAAVFGEIDPVTGVSANIMTGQPIRGGTAFSDILLDEVALLRLQKGLPPVGDYAAGREAPATEDTLETPADDFCSPSRLRMNLTLPTTKARLSDEPDIEFVELEEE
jgi:DNA-directed RNA polymerase beta' subunit